MTAPDPTPAGPCQTCGICPCPEAFGYHRMVPGICPPPAVPDTGDVDARRALLLALALADGQSWASIVEATEHTTEVMYGKQADAVQVLLARVRQDTAEQIAQAIETDCQQAGHMVCDCDQHARIAREAGTR